MGPSCNPSSVWMRQEDSWSSQLAVLNLYFRFIGRLSQEMKTEGDSERTPGMCMASTHMHPSLHAHALTNNRYTALRHAPKVQTAEFSPSLVNPGIENSIFLQVLRIKTIQMFSFSFQLYTLMSLPRAHVSAWQPLFLFWMDTQEWDLRVTGFLMCLWHPELFRLFVCILWCWLRGSGVVGSVCNFVQNVRSLVCPANPGSLVCILMKWEEWMPRLVRSRLNQCYSWHTYLQVECKKRI